MDCSETKLALRMSVAERKLIEDTPLLNEDVAVALKQTSKKVVQLSVSQLDALADALSAKSNQTEARMLQRRLDTLVRKIDQLTGSHLLTLLETSVAPSSVKSKVVEPKLTVTLSPAQREVLDRIGLHENVRRRLQGDGIQTIQFTHREVEHLHDHARMAVPAATVRQKQRLRNICNKIGRILCKQPSGRHPSAKLDERLNSTSESTCILGVKSSDN